MQAGDERDRPMAITAATVFGVVSVLVFIIQPGYVQGLVDLAGLTGAQAGYVASAEMTGYAITVIAMSFLSHRVRWAPMLFACILVQALGNAGCVLSTDATWLAAARFVAGLGAGGMASLAFTAIGMTRDPDRQFGFFIMWILAYGAVGLFGLPSLFGLVGLRGFHLLALAATLGALPFVRFMPAHGGAEAQPNRCAAPLAASGRWAAILSIFVFFLGCGILWAYVSLIGDARGLGLQPVANALSLSQFTGVAGALAAGLVGSRFGRGIPLGLAIVLCAGSTAALSLVDARAALLFGAAVCLFNFAWNVAQPVYLSVASVYDAEGRLVPQMVASQSCGLALGPFVGAEIGGERNIEGLAASVSGLFLLSAVLITLLFVAARRSAILAPGAAERPALFEGR